MRRHGQAGWVKDVERGVVGEHGDGHIEELGVLQGSFTDRLLSPIGNGLDNLSGLPDGQMGEPVCCRVCSGEGRDVAMDAGLDGALTLQHVPYLGADRLLGRVDSGAHSSSSYAAISAMIRSDTSCTSGLSRHRRSWRPALQMIVMPPPPRFRSVTSIARFSLATAASSAPSRIYARARLPRITACDLDWSCRAWAVSSRM